MEVKVVGEVRFKSRVLKVYGDLADDCGSNFEKNIFGSGLHGFSPFKKIREAVSDSNR